MNWGIVMHVYSYENTAIIELINNVSPIRRQALVG